MNPVTELIIGIDLGSNGLKGVLGKRNSRGVEVIALQQIPVFQESEKVLSIILRWFQMA